MIKRKYQDGTKGVKKGPGGDVEKATPSVDPPKEDTSLDSFDPDLPEVRTSPTTSATGLVKGGSAYVAAFQRKLNAQGANLAVDGAWGEKTQAAFEKYQSSPQKGTSRKLSPTRLPKGDKEFTSVTGEESLGKSYRDLATFYDKTPAPVKRKVAPTQQAFDPSFDKAQEPGTSMEEAYAGINYPEKTSPKGEVSKVGNGYQFYSNGRLKSPDGKMSRYSKLPRKSIPMDPETMAARKALKAKLVQASDRKW